MNNLSNTLHHFTATKSQCTHIYHFLTDGTLSEYLKYYSSLTMATVGSRNM